MNEAARKRALQQAKGAAQKRLVLAMLEGSVFVSGYPNPLRVMGVDIGPVSLDQVIRRLQQCGFFIRISYGDPMIATLIAPQRLWE